MNTSQLFGTGSISVPNPLYKKGSKKEPPTIETSDPFEKVRYAASKSNSLGANAISVGNAVTPVVSAPENYDELRDKGIAYNTVDLDFNEQLADKQGIGEQIGRTFINTLWGELVLGTAKGIGDIVGGAMHVLGASPNYSNIVSDGLAEAQQNSEQNNQVYVSEDAAIYNPSYILSKVPMVAGIMSMGFASGAATKGINLIGKGVGINKAIGRARVWASKLGVASGESAKLTDAAEAIANGNRILSESANAAENTLQGLNRFGRWANTPKVVAWANAAALTAENALVNRLMWNYSEAHSVFDQTYTDAVNEFENMDDATYNAIINKNSDALKEAGVDTSDKNAVARFIAKSSADRTFHFDWWNAITDAITLFGTRKLLRNIGENKPSIEVLKRQREAKRTAGMTAEEIAKAKENASKWQKVLDKTYGARVWLGRNLIHQPMGIGQMAVVGLGRDIGLNYGRALMMQAPESSWDERLGDYLSNPDTYEELIWAGIGGIASGAVNAGITKGYRSISKNLKVRKYLRDNPNPTDKEKKNIEDYKIFGGMTAQERSEIAEIDARQTKFEQYTNALKTIADGKDPNPGAVDAHGNAPFLKSNEKEGVIDRVTNEYSDKLILDAIDVGHVDLLNEYVKSDAFKQALVDKAGFDKTEADVRQKQILDRIKSTKDKYNKYFSIVNTNLAYIEQERRQETKDYNKNKKRSDRIKYDEIPAAYARIITKKLVANASMLEYNEKSYEQTKARVEDRINDLKNEKHTENKPYLDPNIDYVQVVKSMVDAQALGRLYAEKDYLERRSKDHNADLASINSALANINKQIDLLERNIKPADDEAASIAQYLFDYNAARSYRYKYDENGNPERDEHGNKVLYYSTELNKKHTEEFFAKQDDKITADMKGIAGVVGRGLPQTEEFGKDIWEAHQKNATTFNENWAKVKGINNVDSALYHQILSLENDHLNNQFIRANTIVTKDLLKSEVNRLDAEIGTGRHKLVASAHETFRRINDRFLKEDKGYEFVNKVEDIYNNDANISDLKDMLTDNEYRDVQDAFKLLGIMNRSNGHEINQMLRTLKSDTLIDVYKRDADKKKAEEEAKRNAEKADLNDDTSESSTKNKNANSDTQTETVDKSSTDTSNADTAQKKGTNGNSERTEQPTTDEPEPPIEETTSTLRRRHNLTFELGEDNVMKYHLSDYDENDKDSEHIELVPVYPDQDGSETPGANVNPAFIEATDQASITGDYEVRSTSENGLSDNFLLHSGLYNDHSREGFSKKVTSNPVVRINEDGSLTVESIGTIGNGNKQEGTDVYDGENRDVERAKREAQKAEAAQRSSTGGSADKVDIDSITAEFAPEGWSKKSKHGDNIFLKTTHDNGTTVKVVVSHNGHAPFNTEFEYAPIPEGYKVNKDPIAVGDKVLGFNEITIDDDGNVKGIVITDHNGQKRKYTVEFDKVTKPKPKSESKEKVERKEKARTKNRTNKSYDDYLESEGQSGPEPDPASYYYDDFDGYDPGLSQQERQVMKEDYARGIIDFYDADSEAAANNIAQIAGSATKLINRAASDGDINAAEIKSKLNELFNTNNSDVTTAQISAIVDQKIVKFKNEITKNQNEDLANAVDDIVDNSYVNNDDKYKGKKSSITEEDADILEDPFRDSIDFILNQYGDYYKKGKSDNGKLFISTRQLFEWLNRETNNPFTGHVTYSKIRAYLLSEEGKSKYLVTDLHLFNDTGDSLRLATNPNLYKHITQETQLGGDRLNTNQVLSNLQKQANSKYATQEDKDKYDKTTKAIRMLKVHDELRCDFVDYGHNITKMQAYTKDGVLIGEIPVPLVSKTDGKYHVKFNNVWEDFAVDNQGNVHSESLEFFLNIFNRATEDESKYQSTSDDYKEIIAAKEFDRLMMQLNDPNSTVRKNTLAKLHNNLWVQKAIDKIVLSDTSSDGQQTHHFFDVKDDTGFIVDSKLDDALKHVFGIWRYASGNDPYNAANTLSIRRDSLSDWYYRLNAENDSLHELARDRADAVKNNRPPKYKIEVDHVTGGEIIPNLSEGEKLLPVSKGIAPNKQGEMRLAIGDENGVAQASGYSFTTKESLTPGYTRVMVERPDGTHYFINSYPTNAAGATGDFAKITTAIRNEIGREINNIGARTQENRSKAFDELKQFLIGLIGTGDTYHTALLGQTAGNVTIKDGKKIIEYSDVNPDNTNTQKLNPIKQLRIIDSGDFIEICDIKDRNSFQILINKYTTDTTTNIKQINPRIEIKQNGKYISRFYLKPNSNGKINKYNYKNGKSTKVETTLSEVTTLLSDYILNNTGLNISRDFIRADNSKEKIDGIIAKSEDGKFKVDIGENHFEFNSFGDFVLKNDGLQVDTRVEDGENTRLMGKKQTNNFVVTYGVDKTKPATLYSLEPPVEGYESKSTTTVTDSEVKDIAIKSQKDEVNFGEAVADLVNEQIKSSGTVFKTKWLKSKNGKDFIPKSIIFDANFNKDITVTTHDENGNEVTKVDKRSHLLGMYNNKEDFETITHDKDGNEIKVTVKHGDIIVGQTWLDLLHSDPAQAIRHLMHEQTHKNLDELGKDEHKRVVESLRSVFDEFQGAVEWVKNSSMSEESKKVCLDVINKYKLDNYRDKNGKLTQEGLEEFLVYSITASDLHRALNVIDRQDGVKGTKTHRPKNLFQKLIDIVAKVFGWGDIRQGSMLEREYEELTKVFKELENTKDKKVKQEPSTDKQKSNPKYVEGTLNFDESAPEVKIETKKEIKLEPKENDGNTSDDSKVDEPIGEEKIEPTKSNESSTGGLDISNRIESIDGLDNFDDIGDEDGVFSSIKELEVSSLDELENEVIGKSKSKVESLIDAGLISLTCA